MKILTIKMMKMMMVVVVMLKMMKGKGPGPRGFAPHLDEDVDNEDDGESGGDEDLVDHLVNLQKR